jgi:hypothetical protein
VALPLHRWLVGEAILQYHQRYHDPQAYSRDHPDAAAAQTLRAVLRASRAPATAAEAHAAARRAAAAAAARAGEEPGEEERPRAAAPAAVPALASKHQQQTLRAAKEASDPGAALEAALRRTGMLPLPPGVVSSPTDPSCPDLGAEARAGGWRCTAALLPTAEFEARCAAAGAGAGAVAAPAELPGARWRASARNYCLPLTKAAFAEAAAAGRGGGGGGAGALLPPPAVRPGAAAAGGGLVLHLVAPAPEAAAVDPNQAGTSASAAALPAAEHVALHLCPPPPPTQRQPSMQASTAPSPATLLSSVQAKAALEELRRGWPT